jgi:hypothetical protein
MFERKKLGEILVDLGVLKDADVDRVLEAQRRRGDRQKKFGQLARDMGLIEEEHILAALAVQMDLLPGIQDLSLEEIMQGLLASSGVDD